MSDEVEPLAVNSFYFQTTAGATPAWCGTINTSAGTNAVAAFGWQVGKTATSSPYMRGFIGATATSSASAAASSLATATGPRLGTGSGATTASDFFRTAAVVAGNFPAGNWTFNFTLRTTVASTQAGRMRFRLWASTDPTGANARELTSGVVTSPSIVTLSATATTYNSTGTWAAPNILLAGEYLFLSVEWQITTAGGSNTANVVFYSASTPASVITTNATALDYGTATDLDAQAAVVSGSGTVVSPTISGTGDLDPTEAVVSGSGWSGSYETTDPNTVLLQHYDGNFVDDSDYNHPFYTTGAISTSTTQEKFGTSSLYLGNSGGPHIECPDAPELRFQGDFTLDFWIWLTTNPVATTEFITKIGPVIAFYSPVYVEANSGGGVDVYMSSNGTSWDIMTSLYSGTFSNNAWHHIALVRSGNNFTIYRDGTAAATISSSLQPVQSTDPLQIGTQFAAVDGYIDELRISKVARWTADFTPPAQPYILTTLLSPDASALSGSGTVTATVLSGTGVLVAGEATLTGTGNIVLPVITGSGLLGANTPPPDFLLHGESFVDSTGKHTVNNGGSTISSTQQKFGTSSIQISNSNVYLDGAANLSIASGDDFCIDFWAYPTNTSSVHPMSAWYDGATDNLDVCIRGSGCLQVFDHGGLVIVGGTAFTLNGWNHVALTRQSGALRGFLNGVLQGTNNSNTNAFPVSGQSPSFGRGVVGGTQQYAGYFDEIRFIKGQAVWTANFTPPAAPYSLGSPATVSGIGTAAWYSSGILSAGTALVAGVGTVANSATGVLAAGSAVVTGVGNSFYSVTGVLVDGLSGIAGVGYSASRSSTSNLTAGISTLAGVGTSASRGTGTLVGGSSTIASVGTSESRGTGTIVGGLATVTGSGTLLAANTGSLVVTAAGLAGTGASSSVGIGTLPIGAATLSGSVNARWDSQGTLTAQASVVTGVGTARSIGTGSLVVGTAYIAGFSGPVILQSTGVLVAGVSTLAGSANVTSRGTGTLVVPASTLSGIATARYYGTGTLQARSSIVAGSAFSGIAAIGDLDAASGNLTGSATATWYTTGTLQASVSSLTGSARVTSTGTGILVSLASGINGTGSAIWNATGVLYAGVATLSGTAVSGAIFGEGDLVAGDSSLSGEGGNAPALGETYPRTVIVPDTIKLAATGSAARIIQVGTVPPPGTTTTPGTRTINTGNGGRTIVVNNGTTRKVAA